MKSKINLENKMSSKKFNELYMQGQDRIESLEKEREQLLEIIRMKEIKEENLNLNIV